jgi:hypothetical protein
MVDMYCITASTATKDKIQEYMNNSNKKNVSSFIDGIIHIINNSNVDNYISILCGKVSITIKKEANDIQCQEQIEEVSTLELETPQIW